MSEKRHLRVDAKGGPVDLPLERGHWLPDHDDEGSADDLFVRNCDVHVERMSSGYYWIGIYVDGELIHVDVTSARRMRAVVRR